MNNPFRVYLKVKVKENQMGNYLQVAGDVIATVKDSEPEELQYEDFFNKETSEVVWLQSYSQASSFDVHLANPEIKALSGKMIQSK